VNLKKHMFIGFPILIVLAVTILVSCGGKDMSPEKALNSFSKLLEKENLDDLRLTIYYIDPSILTRAPLSVDGLINNSHVNKVVVNSSNLKEHIDLLNQFNLDLLQPVENNTRIDARFYYMFETKKNRKIFDVGMWGGDNSIFVNGIEVQENDIFYDVVIPFLPEEIGNIIK